MLNNKTKELIATTSVILYCLIFVFYFVADTKVPQGNVEIIETKSKASPEYIVNEGDINPVNSAFYRSRIFIEDIHENCWRKGMTTKWTFIDENKPRLLVYSNALNVLYSSNPKTGSYRFKKFLSLVRKRILMTNKPCLDSPEKCEHFMYLSKKTRINEPEFENAFKVGVIRNPLTRIVSGVRDKFIRRDYFGRFKKYDKKYLSDFEIFKDFVNTGHKLGGKYNAFAEKHFAPQFHNMRVCNFPYDLLIDYEHIKEGLEAFQIIVNYTDVSFTGSRKDIGRDNVSSTDVAIEWYAKLDNDTLNKIYEIYKVDFEIFGYSKWGDKEFPMVKTLYTP